MDKSGEYSTLHGTCCDNQDCGFFDNDNEHDELDDDVFSLDRQVSLEAPNRAQASRTTCSSGYVSDLTPPPIHPSETRLPKPSANVMTQTDFPADEPTEPVQDPDVAPEPSLESPRRPTVSKSFCWRHDGFSDVVSPPARPSSLCSEEQGEVQQPHPGVTPRVGYRHQSCQICKSHFDKRLNLKSRKELTNTQKIPADPTVAQVKSCPVNLLADKITRCSNLWTEDRTFYLGVDAGRLQSNLHMRRHSARLPSRRSGHGLLNSRMQTRSCSFCNDDKEDVTDDVAERRKSNACGRHSFWIRTLTLPPDKKSRPMSAWKEPENIKGKRNWILVQCVTKHTIKPLCSAEPEPKLFYREIGAQEMILCPSQNRTVEVIEDICCQHFIKSSKKEALENGRKVELMFSAKGPMVRDDKHLTGRSIFFFCCDEPITRRYLCDACKLANEKLASLTTPPIFSVPPASAPPKQARSNIRKSAPSLPSPLASMVRVGRRNSKASAGLKRSNSRASSAGSASNASNAFAITAITTTTSSDAACYHTEKPAKKSERPAKKEKQKKPKRGSRSGELRDDEDMKKSVTFAVEESKDENEEPVQINQEALKRRASLPPPPPKLLPKKEVVDSRRKRRESVRVSFCEKPPTMPKKEKIDEVPRPKPAAVRPYNQPEWCSILITVTFQDKQYSREFLEYKTLQDLYTWLREKFLEDETLKPGAELLLHHDNLKFPLKANTASTQLSNLPTSDFTCEQISKEQQGGGFGEGSSRFDTRFSLPIDMRNLENLTPAQYLTKFCKLPPTWRAFYRNTFTQNDKDRDGKLTFKELDQAMEHLFVELAVPLLNRVLYLMGIDPRSQNLDHVKAFELNTVCRTDNLDVGSGKKRSVPPWQNHLTVDVDTFISMCALGNRIICREKEIDGIPVDSIKQRGTELEDADFYNIEGKLKSFNIQPSTRKLLIYIRNR